MALLLFSWGAITIGSGGVTNFTSLAVTRFLLGIFEAGKTPNQYLTALLLLASLILIVLPLGMYPGLVFYLTFWYRPEERSLRIAIFLACASLAGAFGGTIAYAVGHMNGVAGLAAWRWLFILEGVPTCLFAFVVLLFLPDFPESAAWLNAEEKALAADRMRSCGSKGGDKAMTWVDTRKTLMEWRLYAHYLVQSAPFTQWKTGFKVAKDQILSYTSSSQYLSLASPSSFLQ